jgi:hypothetical protein
MTPTAFRPSRRELIRWAAATSILSGIPLGCGGSTAPMPPEPWKPVFLTADEVVTLDALADTLFPPEADGTGGGKALATSVFVDRLLTALDAAPRLHAEGPFSGRQPFDDGKGGLSKKFPEDQFLTFAPLDRVNATAWKLKLFGSKAVEGGAPNEALLGAVTGLREDVRGLLTHAKALKATFATESAAERLRLFNTLEEGDRDLAIELVCQAVFAAPEYGGNAAGAGWSQIHFEGDSQPLGYSLWDAANNVYKERADFPMSTANPGSDPDPLDGASKDLIETVVKALGGRIAS